MTTCDTDLPTRGLQKMSRRSFMAGLAAVGAAAQLPIPQFSSVSNEAKLTTSNLPTGDVWVFDTRNKKVIYRGEPDQAYSVQELYHAMKDQFRSELKLMDEPTPMFGITPTQFEMNEGWTLDDSAPAHLNHGSITEGEHVWSSIVELEQGCAPRPLPLAPHDTQPDDSQSSPGWNQLRHPGVMYVPVDQENAGGSR